MNEPAETALRVNTLRASPEDLGGELAGEGVRRPADGLLGAPEALVVSGRIGPRTADRIEAGDLVPQSRASQAVVSVLDPLPGERVLDLCAGPGIKTTAIAARLRDEGSVTAVEVDAARARRIEELAKRLDARCVIVVNADARGIDPGAEYDRVLVDPPCTDLGTLAARPDARWRKSPKAVARMAQLGGELLGAGAAAVRPGGRVVYSTCTISRAENESVVAGFLDGRRGFAAAALGAEHPELAAGDGRFLQTRPDRDGTSGFFIARLEAAEA